MTPLTPLPSYDQEYLRERTPAELIALMIENEDRVTRNVIDECSRRGDAMAEALAPWAHPAENDDENLGQWWLPLHAVMILGLVPGEHAAAALLEYIHELFDDSHENAQEWLSGYWPALTRNKPAELIEQLRIISEDRRNDWYMRVNLLDAVIAAAQREGETQLDAALDWAARIAADETEDWDMRMLTAGKLLEFPRQRHRPLLDDLAAQQSGFGVHFTKENVAHDYARNTDQPECVGADPKLTS
jgi:hypothetical protein